MGTSSVPSAESITAEEFQEYLDRYMACVEAISASKGAKPGQKTLAELDRYRYGEALDLFDASSHRTMGLDDVKNLVEWKLRHGKFRPSLMKLVSSNPPEEVEATTQSALEAYRSQGANNNNNKNASTALDILTRLKGIGPATASLLLAVHDPDKVIFFADEAFEWLCGSGGDGAKGSIKYSASEYKMLHGRALAVAKRLGVRAVDVEKVAFVLVREPPGEKGEGKEKGKEKGKGNGESEAGPAATPAPRKPKGGTAIKGKPPTKRKADAAIDSNSTGSLRRSKRGKPT